MSNDAHTSSPEVFSQRPVRPRRSVLYVPAANLRAMEKTASLKADAIVFDLEDSVAPESKDEAREQLRSFLKTRPRDNKEIAIRINGLETPHGTEDLLAARAIGCDAILLPKVETPAQIMQAAAALAETDADETVRLWAMIETARGILACGEIATKLADPQSRLDSFVVGPNDLVKETRIEPGRERANLHPWLMQIVLAAKAGGLDVLDGVYNDFRDPKGFAAECRQARSLGFDGKTLIHPSQIEDANEAFGIDDDALAETKEIVAAFERPENAGKGVIAINGRMVERLHRDQAIALIDRAAAIARNNGEER